MHGRETKAFQLRVMFAHSPELSTRQIAEKIGVRLNYARAIRHQWRAKQIQPSLEREMSAVKQRLAQVENTLALIVAQNPAMLRVIQDPRISRNITENSFRALLAQS